MKLVKGNPYVFAFSCTIALLLYSNVMWSCVSTFDCSEFWPTVGYIACYRGHDRLFMLTMVLLSCVQPFFVLITALHLAKDIRFNVVYIGIGVLVSVLLPFIALLDECNMSEAWNFDIVHFYFMLVIIPLSLLWVYMTLTSIQANYSIYRYAFVNLVFFLITIGQWYFTHKGFIDVNYSLEAALEWITVLLSIFLPYVISYEFPHVQFHFYSTLRDKI